MVSGRTCSITSNLQVEVDPDHVQKEHDEYRDSQHQNNAGATHGQEDQSDLREESQESPGKMLMQSVTDILAQSAQSVKDFVSGNGSPTTATEIADPEEKTFLQSMGEKFAQSAQSVKDVVNGTSEGSHTHTENGEERTLLQSVGERIVESAKTVKDAVNGSGDHENITTDSDETGEASILVHSILD